MLRKIEPSVHAHINVGYVWPAWTRIDPIWRARQAYCSKIDLHTIKITKSRNLRVDRPITFDVHYYYCY